MNRSRETIILPHGGYRRLRSFQCAQMVYDGTVVFCERFVDRFSRTRDQMVQAARSGVQNIAEGSMASATSRKTELKLTGIARASLEELLLDYEDFLRQRGMEQWDKDSEAALRVRNFFKQAQSGFSDMSDRSDRSDGPGRSDLSDRSDSSELPDWADPYSIGALCAQDAANTLICLTNQASFLLARQIASLERRFLESGGFSERMYSARKRARRRN